MNLQMVLAQGLVVLGALLMGVGAVGLIRLPDVYNRTNAVAKASSLGMICLLLGVLIWKPSTLAVFTLIPAILLQLLTSPISGFAIGRAAYRSRAPMIEETHLNELKSDPPR
ncbi:monovalent cation/H(+) antiporter subunit G [Streptomyces bohaiensis]|uniref:Monovalent cation/H(+) antiporter subunit G n=1 Tax=Streptomyces bohaiensis TaxID=1431344 RepID=A0ABX1CCI9_9ACTN|nr:monovalent cation/H(+) antiporter subunit G [Streptomyces bohaiensis]NJQ14874.1 monovalent cation/H(+) antiporter subunit G [Streptomyces bohaiensis]